MFDDKQFKLNNPLKGTAKSQLLTHKQQKPTNSQNNDTQII